MRRSRRVPSYLSAALILTISVIWGGAAEAQSGPRKVSPMQFSGQYRYAESLDHGRELVNQTIQELISNLSPVFRRTLRKAANKRDFLVRSIRINVTPEQITYRAVAYKGMTVRSEPNLPYIHTSRSGRVTKVIQRFRGDQFEQIILSEYGEMHNIYTLVDDGQRMRVESTMSGKLLRNPVTIELEYERVVREAPAKTPRRRRARSKRPRNRPRVRPPRTIRPRPRLERPAGTPQVGAPRRRALNIQNAKMLRKIHLPRVPVQERPEPPEGGEPARQ